MATKKVGTDKPHGLKIERDGLKFTFSWKKGETYGDGQQVEYKLYEAKSQKVAKAGRDFLKQDFEISGTKWVPISGVSASAKEKSITLSASNYYPTSGKPILYGIAFRVRGQADEYSKTKKGKTTHYDPQWSAWVEKTIVINPPEAPSVEESWDSSYTNRSTYTWTTPSDAKDKKPVTNTEYQSFPMLNCPEDIKGLEDWESATSNTGTLNTSTYYDETGLSGVSKTRCFRIRARGIGGYSSWVYSKHVFAAPLAANITSCTALHNSTTHVWNITAYWDTPQDAGHPVDHYTLQYRIGKPGANMAVTSDGSWTDCGQTTAGDIAVQVTEAIDEDECLWLRVAASHDNHTGANAVVGSAVLAYKMPLAAPTSLSITASSTSTHEVSISVKNNCGITDSKIAIVYQPSNEPTKAFVVDVLTGSGTITKSGIKCPDWTNTGTLGLYAYAYVGKENYITDTNSVKHYNVTTVLESDKVFTSGGIPKAPATVTAIKNGDEIEVNWAWTWESANKAEVSWSTNPNAWESTDQPDTFVVSSTGPAHLFISDVDLGVIYYVRVRLLYDDGDETTYGPYSGTRMVNMTAAPQKPVLDVSSDSIKPGGDLTLSWTYVSMDGTPQAHAKIYESGVSVPIAQVEAAQHVTITPSWTAGTQHSLTVIVWSESGQESPVSDAVVVNAANPPTCTITQTNLSSSVPGVDGYAMTAFPLTVTVTGAGTAGQTTLEIVRAEDFVQKMPDDKDSNGFEDQVVFRRIYSGQSQQTINYTDIAQGAHLDDTAKYRIIAVVVDGYGQTDDDAVDFTVAWSHQAVAPTASVEIQDTAAYIAVGAKPTGAANTDEIDIYRLSVDAPELIYSGATFGDVIVDPFPTIGEYGGYRISLRTKDGDLYDADQDPAWKDYDSEFEPAYQYIDFNGFTLPLSYDVDLESGWTKDFKVTKYLGGHEEGDWLEGVSRKGNAKSVLITEEDTDDIKTLRKLATYSGPAHIRSKDGSSYTANVDVSNESMTHSDGGQLRSITLSIQATRRAVLDGLPQAQWEA